MRSIVQSTEGEQNTPAGALLAGRIAALCLLLEKRGMESLHGSPLCLGAAVRDLGGGEYPPFRWESKPHFHLLCLNFWITLATAFPRLRLMSISFGKSSRGENKNPSPVQRANLPNPLSLLLTPHGPRGFCVRGTTRPRPTRHRQDDTLRSHPPCFRPSCWQIGAATRSGPDIAEVH